MSAAPSWLKDGWPHVWLPYTQMRGADQPLPAATTKGTRITLEDGSELIDGIASWWTACHGYNHPHITGAIHEQLDKMAHVMFGGLGHQPAFDLARRLATILPGDLDHVFFSDSGSVAVEVAMKMALQYWINKGQPDKRRFLSFHGGYHGDTTGAMSVTDPTEGMHALFAGILPKHYFTDIPADAAGLAAFDEFLKQNHSTIAAVIIEPMVQGAGGMRFHEPEILAAMHAAAKKRGLLFISDEIFTGFGRTGDKMFGIEHWGVDPDIMTMAKGIANGMPLAATIATPEVADAFDKLTLSTFGGNPVSAAAANATIGVIEDEGLPAQATVLGAQLRSGLESLQRRFPRHIGDVRGMGLMQAIEIVVDEPNGDRTPDAATSARIFEDTKSRGLLIGKGGLHGNIFRLAPPMTITSAEIDEALGILAESFEALGI